MRRARRFLWVALGGMAMLLGLLGVALPVLPTTPFVILAAFAFGRGSPRLAQALEVHPRFGPVLARWRAEGAIAPRHKALALGMMVAAFSASMVLAVAPMVLLVQAVCLSAAGAYVLTRPDGTA